MARRILNRKDMRADFDAAERKKGEEEEKEEVEEEDEDDDDEDDDEESDDEEEESEGEESEEEPAAGGDDEDDEDRPRPKKKKVAKAKPVKAPAKKSRARTAKVVRQRVVWGVFSNSHQCVATYEYPRKAEADQHAARLMADKKSTHFVQPVREPWEDREKKDDEKEKKGK